MSSSTQKSSTMTKKSQSTMTTSFTSNQSVASSAKLNQNPVQSLTSEVTLNNGKSSQANLSSFSNGLTSNQTSSNANLIEIKQATKIPSRFDNTVPVVVVAKNVSANQQQEARFATGKSTFPQTGEKKDSIIVLTVIGVLVLFGARMLVKKMI